MFYSHELLQDPKHGVSTIWMIANTGITSNPAGVRVTRRVIERVNVRKACEKIVEPGAPIALRVQGNLLFGVTRVYEQKTRYILSDLEKVKIELRVREKERVGLTTDPKAGKANPTTLLVPNDPEFDADQDFVRFSRSLNLSLEEILARASTRASSRMSPVALSKISSRRGSVSLDLGNDGPSFLLPAHEAIIPSSAQKVPYSLDSGGDMLGIGEGLSMDLGIEFNAEGEEVPVGTNATVIVQQDDDVFATDLEVLNSRKPKPRPILDMENIYDIPDEEPPRQPYWPVVDPFADELAGETREPIKGKEKEKGKGKKRGRKSKKILVDEDGIDLPLATWKQEAHDKYIEGRERMRVENEFKVTWFEARKKAWDAVYGNGIGNVGLPHGTDYDFRDCDPFAELFSGLKLTKGGGPTEPKPRKPRTRRRKADEAFGEEGQQAGVPKRNAPEGGIFVQDEMNAMNEQLSQFARMGEAEMGRNQIATANERGQNMGSMANEPEMGRNAPTYPQMEDSDRRLSGIPSMGLGSALNSAKKPRVMSSPRPQQHNSIDFVHRFNDSFVDMNNNLTGGGLSGDVHTSSTQVKMAGNATTEAGLDTSKEEFLDFVQVHIREGGVVADEFYVDDAVIEHEVTFDDVIAVRKSPAGYDHSNNESDLAKGSENSKKMNRNKEGRRWVRFEDLIRPEQHTAAVAAQAFFHTLGLASEGRIRVKQDEGRPFGAIGIGIIP